MTGDAGPLCYALPENEAAAAELSRLVGATVGRVESRRFPDGETYVRLHTSPRDREVILVATLARPDEHLMPLLLTADAARGLGARRVGLVMPYHPYLRQDTRFHRGEAISARTFTSLIGARVDWMVTAEPHLHRITALSELYTIPTQVVHCARQMGTWITTNVRQPLIVGPDGESEQWASAVAAAAGAPLICATKVRRGDVAVVVHLPDATSYRDYTPVLVDDIISTGHTMIEVASQLRAMGLRTPVCVATHAVFSPGTIAALYRAGLRRIVTTNSVPHATSAIDIVPAIADAIKPLVLAPVSTPSTPRE
jgi:ribose-phosphate pyrophosphokinase